MKYIISILFFCVFATLGFGQTQFSKDTLSSPTGDVIITFIGHGSLLFEWQGKKIYIDPSSRKADLYQFPKADMIFVTHHHGDHCDPAALKALTQDKTKTFMSSIAHEIWGQGMVLYPEQQVSIDNVGITVVNAYNLVNKNDEGIPYHKEGECNGYLFTLGNLRIYVAGDTENTPEMKALKHIDAAFLPMKLPYTMNPEMVADGAKGFKPKILYPYHYDKSLLTELQERMENVTGVELRIKNN